MRVTMLLRNTFTHDSRVDKEARTLSEAGHAVTVLAEAGDSLPAQEQRDGYRLYRIRRPIPRIPLLRFFAYRQALVEAAVRTRPDLLHAHDSDTLEPAGAAARRLRVPFIYDAHELWLGQIRRDRSRAYWWAFLGWYWVVQQLLIRRAAAVVTVSPPIARHLEVTYHLPRVQVVANFPEVEPDLARRELRSLPGTEGIPADAPIVLRLGNLSPGRGVEQLVEAMCEVDQAHLVLLGRGSSEPEIRALAERLGLSERVHVVPPVPEPEVVGYAASADVGVSPAIPASLNDAYSLPNKLFQYMAAGIPVVASDFPHLREIVSGSGAGVNVDASRPDRLGAALRDVLADREAAAEMGRRARQAVLERYNWTAASQELLAAYAAALGHPS
jgi:glycosyltransferase involved in cell wall biosynthesis